MSLLFTLLLSNVVVCSTKLFTLKLSFCCLVLLSNCAVWFSYEVVLCCWKTYNSINLKWYKKEAKVEHTSDP